VVGQRTKSLLLWLLALVITLGSAYYQRRTGPSYALRGHATVGAESISYRLPRSHEGEGDATIAIPVESTGITGQVAFRRYKSTDSWQVISMTRREGELTAALPHQPPAGKIMYRVTLTAPGTEPIALTRDPIIVRFTGEVPLGFLLTHIVLMFAAMLWSTRTGFEALARGSSVPTMALWTVILLFFGGMILGPVIQKYAFGAFWTGWPAGHDLTDNKTAVAFIVWVIALWRVRRQRDRRLGAVVAAVVLLAIFLIPHSVLGSEIDYTQMPEGTGGLP